MGNITRLRVWYGLRKLTPKVIRKPSIIIVFENSWHWKTEEKVKQMMKVVHTRYQTEEEASDAQKSKHIYSIWEILILHDKRFKKSPELAIQYNSYADRKQISEAERNLIADKLRAEVYSFYNLKEPQGLQLSLNL